MSARISLRGKSIEERAAALDTAWRLSQGLTAATPPDARVPFTSEHHRESAAMREAVDSAVACLHFRASIDPGDGIVRTFHMHGTLSEVRRRALLIFSRPASVVIEPWAFAGPESADPRLTLINGRSTP